MSRLPKLSGAGIIKVLTRDFGFENARQKGSHVVLKKFLGNEKIVTVVPLHKEVKMGTLLGILELARIQKEEFLDKLHGTRGKP